jgi:hypothetical protein
MQTLVQRRAAPRNRPLPSHTVAVFTGNLDSLIVAAVLSAIAGFSVDFDNNAKVAKLTKVDS